MLDLEGGVIFTVFVLAQIKTRVIISVNQHPPPQRNPYTCTAISYAQELNAAIHQESQTVLEKTNAKIVFVK